jgi:hypothetical protein
MRIPELPLFILTRFRRYLESILLGLNLWSGESLLYFKHKSHCFFRKIDQLLFEQEDIAKVNPEVTAGLKFAKEDIESWTDSVLLIPCIWEENNLYIDDNGYNNDRVSTGIFFVCLSIYSITHP